MCETNTRYITFSVIKQDFFFSKGVAFVLNSLNSFGKGRLVRCRWKGVGDGVRRYSTRPIMMNDLAAFRKTIDSFPGS